MYLTSDTWAPPFFHSHSLTIGSESKHERQVPAEDVGLDEARAKPLVDPAAMCGRRKGRSAMPGEGESASAGDSAFRGEWDLINARRG